MIDLDKWGFSYIRDVSTLKFAYRLWPTLVAELKAARKLLQLQKRQLDEPHRDLGCELAEAERLYAEACEEKPNE